MVHVIVNDQVTAQRSWQGAPIEAAKVPSFVQHYFGEHYHLIAMNPYAICGSIVLALSSVCVELYTVHHRFVVPEFGVSQR
ncbi:MAG: hypothetical protein R3C68_12675 [Myxococcota bacterium]